MNLPFHNLTLLLPNGTMMDNCYFEAEKEYARKHPLANEEQRLRDLTKDGHLLSTKVIAENTAPSIRDNLVARIATSKQNTNKGRKEPFASSKQSFHRLPQYLAQAHVFSQMRSASNERI